MISYNVRTPKNGKYLEYKCSPISSRKFYNLCIDLQMHHNNVKFIQMEKLPQDIDMKLKHNLLTSIV